MRSTTGYPHTPPMQRSLDLPGVIPQAPRPPRAVAAPKVSVLLMTYNHESFLAQAIESVLMQQVNFACEFIIAEDCSTDGTADIAVRFATRYPDRIRLLAAGGNRGMSGNFRNALEHCRGDYIALIEGDDYWTSPHKLRKQAELLDARPDASLCFHPVHVAGESAGARPEVFPQRIKPVLTLQDLLCKNWIPTASVLFRRDNLREVPDWFASLAMIDWPLFVLLAERGAAVCIDEPMAVYRRHEGGLWTRKPYVARSEAISTMQECLRKHLRKRHRRAVSQSLSRTCFELALYHESAGRFRQALAANWRSIRACPFGSHSHKLHLARLCLTCAGVPSSALDKCWTKMRAIACRAGALFQSRTCAVCGAPVSRFIPLSDFYAESMAQHRCAFGLEDFETLNAAEYSCPHCGASDRDRLCALYLWRQMALLPAHQKIRLLDIAPSAGLAGRLRKHPQIEYRCADLLAPDVDDRLDVMDMRCYGDGCFDVFLCSHVLEHVPDDRKALRELFRILNPSGWGLILVPVCLNAGQIDEDPDLKDTSERWRRFGQDDHVRLYSRSGFLVRLRDAGFLVEQPGVDFFGRGEFQRHGITPRSVLYVVRKR